MVEIVMVVIMVVVVAIGAWGIRELMAVAILTEGKFKIHLKFILSSKTFTGNMTPGCSILNFWLKAWPRLFKEQIINNYPAKSRGISPGA